MTDTRDEYPDGKFGDGLPDASSGPRSPEVRGTRLRTWIAGVLAIIATGLFLVDRYIALVKPNIDKMENRKREATLGEFEHELHRVLGEYGILDSWITQHRIVIGDSMLRRDEWRIAIPRDIAVASINHDIKSTLDDFDTHTFAVENAKTRQVTIHVRIGATVRYSLVFTPTAGLKRAAGKLMFMVDNLGDAPSSEIDALLANRDPIICYVTPSRDVVQTYEKLLLAQKAIVLHIHIFAKKGEKSQFVLSEELDESEIRKKIRAIGKSFHGAEAFVLTTEITPSAKASFIVEELKRSGLRSIDPILLSYMDRISESASMSSRVNDISNTAVRSGLGIGVVELKSEIIEFLVAEMSRLRKRGYDFIRPVQMP